MIKKIIISSFLFLILPAFFYSARAITYDLIAPQGTLKRGTQVQFTIYLNTEGTTLTTGEIGANYETQYLEYLNITPGPAMTSVVATPQGTGSFLITGTNTSGFNGNNVFAYLNFKLIADAPGSAQLCVLWAPPTSPTPNPTTATKTPTPNPTLGIKTPTPTGLTIKPTNALTLVPTLKPTSSTGLNPTVKAKNPPPAGGPTSLPKTGSTKEKEYVSLIGGLFLAATTVGLLIMKNA